MRYLREKKFFVNYRTCERERGTVAESGGYGERSEGPRVAGGDGGRFSSGKKI